MHIFHVQIATHAETLNAPEMLSTVLGLGVSENVGGAGADWT